MQWKCSTHVEAVCRLNVAQPLYQEDLFRAVWKKQKQKQKKRRKKRPTAVCAEKRQRGKQPSRIQTHATHSSGMNVNKLLHALHISAVKPDTFSLAYFG